MSTRDALLVIAVLVLIEVANSKDPCKSKTCPNSQICVSVVSPCNDPPCYRVAKCVPYNTPSLCPKVYPTSCRVGYVQRYDNNGCLTNTCYMPCEGIPISPQRECLANFFKPGSHILWKQKKMCYGDTDPHYHTFDGSVIHYMGIGQFIISQRSPKCSDLQYFQLIGYQQPLTNPDVSYLIWIELHVFSSGKITTVRIGASLQILVNGHPFNAVDTMPPGITSIDVNNGEVVTNFGVVVKFNGIYRGTIWIPISYEGCVEGLCANADGIANNDWINRHGVNCIHLPDNMKYWCVGNSWRYGELLIKEQTKDKVRLTCTARNKRLFNRNNYCGTLKNKRGPFGKCLRSKATEGKNSYSSCMFDCCANQNNKVLAKKLACETIEAFAEICGSLAKKNWRKVAGCRCPGDLLWTKCGRDCTRTCRKPVIHCSFKCKARCQCPRSKPYQQGNTCLDERKCSSLWLWPSHHIDSA